MSANSGMSKNAKSGRLSRERVGFCRPLRLRWVDCMCGSSRLPCGCATDGHKSIVRQHTLTFQAQDIVNEEFGQCRILSILDGRNWVVGNGIERVRDVNAIELTCLQRNVRRID